MEERYNIELTKEQLLTIANSLDVYSRIVCMQFDDPVLWDKIDDVVDSSYNDVIDKNKLKEFRDIIKQTTRQYIGEVGAQYDATPFTKECYHIKKSIKSFLCKEKSNIDDNHHCINCNHVLCNDLSKITINKKNDIYKKLKIYQVHKYTGEYEDFCDEIVYSSNDENDAKSKLLELQNATQLYKDAADRCSNCPHSGDHKDDFEYPNENSKYSECFKEFIYSDYIECSHNCSLYSEEYDATYNIQEEILYE